MDTEKLEKTEQPQEETRRPWQRPELIQLDMNKTLSNPFGSPVDGNSMFTTPI